MIKINFAKRANATNIRTIATIDYQSSSEGQIIGPNQNPSAGTTAFLCQGEAQQQLLPILAEPSLLGRLGTLVGMRVLPVVLPLLWACDGPWEALRRTLNDGKVQACAGALRGSRIDRWSSPQQD